MKQIRFNTFVVFLTCLVALILGTIGIMTIKNNHAEEMEVLQNILAEVQVTPEPVFIRGSSKYVPSEEHTLSHADSDLFSKFLILEGGLTEDEYPTTNTTLYAIGAVVMNRVESPYFPDTIMEVLAQFPSFAKLNDFQISITDKRWRTATSVVDDLVVHEYRPINQNILFYSPQGSEYDGPGKLVFETIDFRFYEIQE